LSFVSGLATMFVALVSPVDRLGEDLFVMHMTQHLLIVDFAAILLILGLGTRLATLPLLGMIAVIQTFVYPNAYAEHLTWASILLFLLTRGGGSLSVDRAIGLEPADPR